MDRELAARKLSLQFDLDESLPAVLGDRTQIQRVLSYLMAKLFESPHAEQGNSGRILLRTAASDGRYLILDLSDSENIGTDEEMEQLFESVFDAKDANGATQNWAIELVGINDLLRLGWGRNRVKAGDVVSVDGFGARNGTNTANAASVSLANGELLWASTPKK